MIFQMIPARALDYNQFTSAHHSFILPLLFVRTTTTVTIPDPGALKTFPHEATFRTNALVVCGGGNAM
jgi:hypothetical protein